MRCGGDSGGSGWWCDGGCEGVMVGGGGVVRDGGVFGR